jgi:hypothetical protein
MILTLSDTLASELSGVLSEVIGDMSSEIADTDNPSYRDKLRERREHLSEIKDQLEQQPAVGTP